MAQFTSNYGKGGWDYMYCWPNVTGTGYHGDRHFSMHTDAYAVRGTITHRIQRHLWAKWRTEKSNTVAQGYPSRLERIANGLQDWMRGGVWNADGNTYHASVYGTD